MSRRSIRPLRTPLVLLAGYAALLIASGVTSRARHIPLGTTVCFDDWCASVMHMYEQHAASPAKKTVVATLRISSIARGRHQHASNPSVSFVDTDGNWYRADRRVGSFPDIRTSIAPGASFRTDVAAIVPARTPITAVRLWEGAWIDRIIPFDEEAPFHQKTMYVVRNRSGA